jgi:hypothetical protein
MNDAGVSDKVDGEGKKKVGEGERKLEKMNK